MGWELSWTEVAGFATGALCVWLVVRRNIWNFAVGMANNVFFWLLFTSAGLYADAWLQVVYFGLGALGWYWWLRGGENHSSLVVRPAPRWAAVAIGTFVTLAGVGIHHVLTRHTDSTVPWADAATTALSLGAQIMLNRKWIGNWWLWIAADVIYIVLYAHKGLHLTSLLYAVFLGMCVVGLRQWRAARDTATAAPVTGDAPVAS